MRTICLFNHKGGVSKTTTAFNLGWTLADQGYKIMLVDLDSQCNLTGLVLGYNAIDDDHMQAFYSKRETLTMAPIVKALIDGRTPEALLEGEQGTLLEVARQDDRVLLLPGHLSISELDSQVSVSLKIATGVPATRNIPGNLPKTLKLIADRNGIDFVLLDLSPNVGGLNEIALMASDYFIVPTTPDFFCLQAISSLERHIVKWHNEIEKFREMNDFDGRDFPIANNPVFLGSIQQRYRPRNERPTVSFGKWISLIRDAINQKLVPSLTKIGCAVDEAVMKDALSGTDLEPYDLAQISDFNSLIAISQQLSKPIFALSDTEIRRTGRVFGHAENTMIDNRDSFSVAFRTLGERIVKLITDTEAK